MTPTEARRLWIKALRSGKYKQTQRTLCADDEGYCCLGVACEVFQQVIGGLTIRDVVDFDSLGNNERKIKEYDSRRGYLPDKVAEWLDITDAGRMLTRKMQCGTLSACNDSGEMNFNQIADIIESGNLESQRQYWPSPA